MNNYLKAELFNSAFFLHEIFFKAFPTFIICIFLNNCGSSDKIYEVKGTIHEINLDKNEVIISHDTIQGLMYPMIMPFTLTDINGRVVMTQNFANVKADKLQLNVANLNTGVYVINIRTEEGFTSARFVKN